MEQFIRMVASVGIAFGISILVTACKQDDRKMGETLQTEPLLELDWQTKAWATSTCAQDSQQCLTLQLRYPLLVLNNQIARLVNDSIKANLDRLLAANLPEDNGTTVIDLDQWAQYLLADYEQIVADDPDYNIPWEIKLLVDSLYQTPFLLSLKVKFYAFTGGAHPNVQQVLLNFDLRDGHKVTLASVIEEEEALSRKLEQVLLQELERLNNGLPTEETANGKLEFPENFALTEEGLYFLYNPLEKVAYGLTLTEFMVPYDEVKNLLNQKGKTLFNKN